MNGSSSPPQFDYIVIGGGTAGLVVASRLSEDAATSVLLIEAGSDRTGDARIDTPGLITSLYGDKDLDWNFLSEPQVHVNGRQIPQPRGRVLGGSSALNFSLVMYPSNYDFEAWVALGNEGWGAQDMGQYLRKFQTFASPDEPTAELLGLDGYIKKTQQGSHGPVPVGFPPIYGPFNQAWDETFAALGWQDKMDPIAGNKLGAFTSPLSVSTKESTRGYAASYYTPEVAQRPNLTLWTEAQVEKILCARDNHDQHITATGVRVRRHNGALDATARHEVILSAGSLHSPQILELSGIGSSDRLQRHGISTLIDLPGVGENLQDHCITAISYKVAESEVSWDIMRDPQVVQSLLQDHQEGNGGPMSGMPFSVAYIPLVDLDGPVQIEIIQKLVDQHLNLDQGKSLQDCPQVTNKEQMSLLRQFLLDGQKATAEYIFFPLQLHTDTGHMAHVFEKSSDGNYITILAMLSHPFSLGSVHIKSPNIQEKPTFDPNYLSHPLDLEILARHTQFIDRLAHTEPLQSFLQPRSRIPEAENADLSNLEVVKEVVKERLFSCFHPAGTCAMMPVEIGGVVDANLKVHGTRNLRVVDASVFPLLPQGNIQATVYAVAERAADLIKQSMDKS
ncbi:aryl-alcohol dehydrogenase [Penicillium desertorum]|uniref:Aryl-alcohol dehydrogenase n=1 Tax=Penicillium desertorum TaxID=1303715 RepID=A0A9X0BL90_9EURO|nr:aryl-alcohol dehydrogenase [Penicillium desertorum]